MEAERSLASKTIVLVRIHPHSPPRQRDSTISHQTQRRRVPYKEPRLGKNSHPIASTHSTIRIRSVDATEAGRATFDNLATLAGDGTRFAGRRGVLRRGMACSRGIGAGGMTTNRFFLLVLVGSLCVARSRNGLSILLILVNGPIKDVVVLETLSHKEVAEDLPEVGVVWLVVKAEGTGIIQINGELVGKAAAQDLGGSGHLLFHDPIILLLLRGGLEPLPWEGAAAEIEHDIPKGFHIVTTRLLYGPD